MKILKIQNIRYLWTVLLSIILFNISAIANTSTFKIYDSTNLEKDKVAYHEIISVSDSLLAQYPEAFLHFFNTLKQKYNQTQIHQIQLEHQYAFEREQLKLKEEKFKLYFVISILFVLLLLSTIVFLFIYQKHKLQYLNLQQKFDDTFNKATKKLQAILDSLDSSIILLDNDFNVKAFNQKAKAEIFEKLDLNINIGDSIFKFLQSNHTEYLKKLENVNCGERYVFERSILNKTGQIDWYEFQLYPVYHNKTIIGVNFIANNINERKENQRKLEENNQSLQFVAESSLSLLEDNIGSNIFEYLYGKINQIFNAEIIAVYIAQNLRPSATLTCKHTNNNTIFQINESIQFSNSLHQQLLENSVIVVDNINFLFFTERQNNILPTSYYYLFPIHNEGIIRGLIVVVSQTEIEDRKKQLVQALIHSATLALQKKLFFDMLMDEKAMLSNLIDYNPNPIAIANAVGNVFRYNDAFNKTFQTDQTQKINLFDYEPFVKAGIKEKTKVLQAGNHIYLDEIKIKNKYFIRALVFPVLNKDNTFQQLVMLAEDITEQKNIEVELQRSKQEYQELLNCLGEGVAVVDAQENFVFSNPSANLIFGTHPDSIVGKNLKSFTTTESFDQIRKESNKRMEGKSSKYELEILTPDGKRKNIFVTATPRFDKQNQYMGSFGIFRDITEHRKTKEDLYKSQEKFKDLFQHANDIVYTMDFDGNITSINPAAEEILGYSLSELNKIPLGKLLTKESLKSATSIVMSHVQNFQHQSKFEVTAIAKNGQKIIFEINSFIRFSDNKPVEIFGIGRNVTLRKKVEESLKFSEEKYRQLFENAPLGIFSVNENGDVLEFNYSFLKILHSMKIDDNITININSLPIMLESGITEKIMQCFKNKEKVTSEHSYINKNGKKRHIRINAKFIQFENNPNKVQVIVEDISKQKKIEKSLKNSLTEKDKLIKEIHHRVKNNMQVIMSLINMTTYSMKHQESIEKLIDVRERVRTMSLVHEDLYLSQSLYQINVKRFTEKLIYNLLQLYDDNGIAKYQIEMDEIEMDIDMAIPVGLIMNELISNALKYGLPKNSKKSNFNIFISCEKTQENYQLIIADNGIGMPDNFQLKNAETMGFQLINLLVENQLNGQIFYQNDKGSKFSINIPCSQTRK